MDELSGRLAAVAVSLASGLAATDRAPDHKGGGSNRQPRGEARDASRVEQELRRGPAQPRVGSSARQSGRPRGFAAVAREKLEAMTQEQMRVLAFILAISVCLHIGWRLGAKLLGWE